MDSKIVSLVEIKAGEGTSLADGDFTGYASVFGNVDSYGDVVLPGAFAETLASWKASGNPIPLLWGHDMHDPFANVGEIVDAVEDERGLWVHGRIDQSTATGKQVYKLIKGRRVTKMSFAYDIIDGASASSEDLGDYYELRKLKLYEVSIVPIGANQETEITAVKAAAEVLAAGAKAGRVLSQRHIDSLRTAQDAIGGVIAAAEASDQEKASGSTPEAKSDEEPHIAVTPDEAPKSDPSVDVLAAQIEILSRKELPHGQVHA